MYPVEGPKTKAMPLPVIRATASGIEGNTGNLTFADTDGGACAGTWSSGAPSTLISGTSLVAIYGGATGVDVSIPAISAMNRGQAFIACDTGTTFQAEFYTGNGTANGFGIAKDNKGNVYRILF